MGPGADREREARRAVNAHLTDPANRPDNPHMGIRDLLGLMAAHVQPAPSTDASTAPNARSTIQHLPTGVHSEGSLACASE